MQAFMLVTEQLTEKAKTGLVNRKSWLEMENLAVEKLQLERAAARDKELAIQRKVQEDVNRQIRYRYLPTPRFFIIIQLCYLLKWLNRE